MKGIALCGFMGCGKTTVALSLQNKYNLSHIDTDKYIEEVAGMTIASMFEKFGESYFRDKEFDAITHLSQKGDTTIALGGGAVMFERNVKALKDNGYALVFIDTDFETIKTRLENDTTRPLLKKNDVKALYEKRYPVYCDVCDIKISCKDEDALTIADMIIEKLR